MISQKMADRINLQINREMFSAYLYLAMAAKMTNLGYTGIARWLTVQYHEEMFHAMKFVRYLEDQAAEVKFDAIAVPAFKENDPKSLFQHVLEHERWVTASIREIMELAMAEKDFATQNLVQWYIDEQVEEEKNAMDILQTIDLLGNTPQGLFMLNIELGKREPSIPLDYTKI
ncbi:MAG: ferritin [Rectinemataceae bacterium]|nr:ferritin [Spirochaetaceae bacterium]